MCVSVQGKRILKASFCPAQAQFNVLPERHHANCSTTGVKHADLPASTRSLLVNSPCVKKTSATLFWHGLGLGARHTSASDAGSQIAVGSPLGRAVACILHLAQLQPTQQELQGPFYVATAQVGTGRRLWQEFERV